LKLLLIVGILAAILMFLYIRLRPFIRMARQMLGIARGVRGAMRQEPDASSSRGGAGDKLVRCETCATWIPSSRAVKLRSGNASYCSHACLESAAQGSKRKAAS
jgi:hypothetical protein